MADPLSDDDARVARVCAFWQGLTPATLAALDDVYDQHARFRDPFNDVRGTAAIGALLARMFERLAEPRFVVLEVGRQQHGALIIWDFHYRLHHWQPRRARRIHGVTHLRFGADGRVIEHRDYWDAAAEVYEQLPLLGTLLRCLKRRLG